MAALTWEALGKRDRAIESLSGAPLTLLMDLQRWPEASQLTACAAFRDVLAAAQAKSTETKREVPTK
jgi:hypothetical protein